MDEITEQIGAETTEVVPFETEETEEDVRRRRSTAFLALAQAAYSKSTTFVDNNYRRQWENNLRHFQSRHHGGSKYYKSSYLYRSKVFRPKTRSAIRNQEAAAVAAFFSNQDVVAIDPQNDNDPMQRASAEILKALVQYRLTKTIPWFLLCIGAYQDAMVSGVVVSYQEWKYREKVGVDGEVEIIEDKPVIRLLPVENLRIDPAAEWTDPINTSPYLIELIPMYVIDVMERMETSDPKTGQPKWKKLDKAVLTAATKQRFDTTRLTREHPRTDSKDAGGSTGAGGLYDVVWVHRNIIRYRSEDFIFYTLGTEHMLSDPMPLRDVYWTDMRPYVMGVCVIESHKVYSSGLAQLGEGVQKELNENANSRLDNVKLVLNKRYLVKRGSQVDLKSITRNAAGSVTMVNDIEKDVKPFDFDDVTASAFQEQDRMNVDFDEVVGNFSTSTIQTNRKLNETVGGMAMLRGNINTLTEYGLRTFSETWVEPVMRQLVKMEQKYEGDDKILIIAAEKAQLFQKYGINVITDQLLDQEITTTVTVGMGATDPLMKMQHFVAGLDIIIKTLATTPPGSLDVMEVAKEVFGFLGFKDGTRFFAKETGIDPEKQQMGQMIEQMKAVIQKLQGQIDNKALDADTKLKLAKIKEMGQDRRTSAQIQSGFAQKVLDLKNPVAGEKIPKGKAAANG